MSGLTRAPALPDPGMSFVGRDDELRLLIAHLESASPGIVTLLGPGGVGKTRLATEVARRIAANGTPIAFADLDAIADTAALPLGIADAVGVRLSSQDDPASQLMSAVSEIEGLLVLDNLEHLVEGAGLISQLHRAAPALRLLVTSRVVLGLREEWVFPVEGLSIEPEGDVHTSPCVELFLDRMRQSNIASTSEDLDAIVDLCRTVEGNPLAIEIAAAWTRSLAVGEIAAEARRDIANLESPLRDVPERHRSVRALFERSWSLLDETDRDILVRLAAFEGGFTREAAGAVAGASTPRLAGLVDRSLVQFRGGGRYRLHELIRQCILESAGGSLPREARDAHLQYYVRFLEARYAAIHGGGQLEACGDIEVEINNIRTALHSAIEARDAEALQGISETFPYFLVVRGRHREALDMVNLVAARAAELAGEAPSLHAGLLTDHGWATLRFGDVAAAETGFRESQRIYDEHGIEPPAGLAERPVAGLGVVAMTRGDYAAAEAHGKTALEVATAANDLAGQAMAYYVLGNVASALGDLPTARTRARQGLECAEQHGDAWFAAYLHADLATIALATGDLAEAERQAEAAYALREAFDDHEGMALALLHLASVALARNDYDRGEQLAREALGRYNRQGDTGGRVRALATLATLGARRGQLAVAAERALRAIGLMQGMSAATPIYLEVLCAAAEVFAAQGDSAGCLDLLEVVRSRPEASHETVARADSLLGRLSSARPARGRLSRISLEATVDAVAKALTETAQRDTAPIVAPSDDLTAREREILDHLSRGASNREIAATLGVSAGTVKWFTARIYDKLGVRNRTGAVAAARSRGVLD